MTFLDVGFGFLVMSAGYFVSYLLVSDAVETHRLYRQSKLMDECPGCYECASAEPEPEWSLNQKGDEDD